MELDFIYLENAAAKNARTIRALEKGLITSEECFWTVYERTFFADEKTWRECINTIPLSLRPKFLEIARASLESCDFMPQPETTRAFDAETTKRLRRPRWIAYYQLLAEMCGEAAVSDAKILGMEPQNEISTRESERQ
jgi:hypothetical protein